MSSAFARIPVSRRLLPAAAVLLAVLALLPARFTRWMSWLADPVQAVLAPISAPARQLTGWLLPSRSAPGESEMLRQLRREVETLTQQHLRDEQEIDRLKREMEEALRLRILNPDTAVRQLTAPVIGSSSDLSSSLMTVRAGTAQGVEPNTVVVAPGLQLVGRVVDASARTCRVQPITSRASISLLVRAMTEGRQPQARLDPAGDGTLRGPVQEEGEGTVEIKRGTLVRLDDPDRWARHAQMLVVGVVEDVSPNPQAPLRRMITVRPTVRIERLSEVVLRASDDPDAALHAAPRGSP